MVSEKSGKMEKVREKSGKLKFASACNKHTSEVAAFGSLWAWTMFIIDTLVAFSKLVTMLVVINVKQRLFKRYAVYR